MRILPTDVDRLFNYGDNVNLKKFSWGSCCVVYLPVASIREDLSLYLHCSEDFLPPEQIECHLSEESIYGILDDPGKAGTKSIVVQVA